MKAFSISINNNIVYLLLQFFIVIYLYIFIYTFSIFNGIQDMNLLKFWIMSLFSDSNFTLSNFKFKFMPSQPKNHTAGPEMLH